VPHRVVAGRAVRFRVPGRAGARTDWAITWNPKRVRRPRSP
jgi:hypothetical protein